MQGSVREIKHQHGRNIVRLKLDNDSEVAWLDVLTGVTVTKLGRIILKCKFRRISTPT